jgi:Domain of unknown function (DUF929)
LVAVLIALVVALVSGGDSNGGADQTAADPAAVLGKVTSVPASVYEAVGAGTASNLPKQIDDPALTADGKPRIAFLGAEYCPYCAAERWALVMALSRFGTFHKIGLTHSSSQDVDPDTPTFSFRDVGYTSDLISFDATETQSNKIVDGQYQKLATPPPEISAVAQKHAAGSIPFVDFGGSSFLSGATYDPSVLAGKTPDEVADALSDPSSPITQGVVGSANALTAAICRATGNKPADVCTSPTITAIQAKLPSGA